MNKRLRSRVLGTSLVSSTMLGSAGLLCTQVALAQDKPSAADQLDRGARLYDQKQYAEAKKILVDVDPAQLPEDLRAKRADLIKNVDLELAKASGPNGAFDAAEANLEGDKLAAAAKGFEAIANDPAAPDNVKENAKLKLAVVKEKQTAKAPQMKELLNQAETLYKEGKLDEAQNALTTIAATGSDLGWEANAKPAKLQAQIDTARTAAARGVTPPTTVAANGMVTPPDTQAIVPGGMAPSTGTAVALPPAAPAPLSDPLNAQVQQDEILRQRAQTQYMLNLDDFDAALRLNPPGYEAAIRDAQAAIDVVNDNRRYFSDAEANTMIGRANGKKSDATSAKAKFDFEQKAVSDAEAKRIAEQHAKVLAKAKQKQIHDLLDAADKFTQQQQYREAADALRHILVIDPTNDGVKLDLKLVMDKITYRAYKTIVDTRSIETQRLDIDNMEHTIPYVDLLVYPENWVELTRNRVGDQSNADTPQNRAVRARLEENLKEISAEQQGFEKVINFLRDNTNTNIFVNWTALQAAGIDKNTPVSVSLKEVPFRKALTTILSEVGGGAAQLGYTIDDGVITISTKDDLNSAKYQVVRVFDIRDMLVQPDTNLNPPTFNLTDITKGGSTTGGTTGGGGGTGGGTTGLFTDTGAGAAAAGTKAKEDIVKEVVDAIKTTVAPESWRDAGGQIGSLRELNGQLIVNQTVDNQTAVFNLLQQLRETRALQIAIEARLLLVSNNFLDVVGVSWNLGWAQGAIDSHLGALSIGNNSAGLATPPGTGIPGSFGSTIGTNSALNITGSIIDNFTLSLIIQATQADQRTVTVTAPRVTLFNGQQGYIAVTQQQNFVSNFNQTVTAGTGFGGAPATATNLTVSTLTTGIVLFVEATVSADRRYVVMKVKPQLSTLDGLDTFSSGGAVINPNSGVPSGSSGFVQLPRISYTTVDTMVSVPDGGTLLIGGEKLVGESEVEIGVPVLSKIPGLNRLFTNRSLVKDERTLLILVRPKIIIQKEIENNLFGVGYDKQTGLPTAGTSSLNGDGVAPGFSVSGGR